MSISEENVYNQWTIISKYHYALGTLANKTVGVKYRYNEGWGDTDSRAFTFWFRPQYKKPIGKNVLITQISNNAGYPMLTTAGLPLGVDEIKTGDWISVRGTNSYNGIQLVKSVDMATGTLTLDVPYTDNIITNTAKLNKEVSNTFIKYDNARISGLKTSKMISKLFKEKDRVFVNCKFNDKFAKWEPFEESTEDKILINGISRYYQNS